MTRFALATDYFDIIRLMPINPVVFRVGEWELHLFTAAVVVAVFSTLGWLLWTARRLDQPLLAWLDAAVGTALGGVIGARMVYIVLESDYFSANPDQMLNFSGGGFDWHGAVLGGLVGGGVLTVVRHVPLTEFFDGLALAVPIGAIAVWGACGQSACAYGAEVRTLADFPAWLVVESPDVYGAIAPRLNLPQIGVWLGLMLAGVYLLLRLSRQTRGLRVGITLGLFALAMAIVDVFRGDYVPQWLGHRADEVLDLLILLLATVLIAGTLLIRKVWSDGLNRRLSTTLSENR